MKVLKEGFLSREELKERVEPLIDEIDEFEAANRNDCYITWNFGQDRDGNVTAGVDLVVDGEDASEENIKDSLEAIFKKHGFGLDDNIKHENPIKTLMGAWHYQIKEMEYEDWHDTADQEQVDQPDYTPELVDDDMNAGFWYESLDETTLAESAPDRITKKFDSSQKAKEFMNSLPKEVEARMEQSDTEEEGNYKTWWEVSYWETPLNVDESLSWENDYKGGFNSLANKILPVNDLGTMNPDQLSRVEGRRDKLWHKEDDGTITPEEKEELKELTKKIEDHYTTKKKLMGESKNPSTITWPNGMPVSDLDLFKALQYNFGADVVKKESDINDYTDEEKQRSVDYYAQSDLDESLDEDLASLFQHIHDTDEHNWNLHGTDYTPFYDELEQYLKPGETLDARDDMGWSADTNVDLATLFRRMPKDKQMDFMDRFYISEAYSQSDLMNAVQDAYGYSKKEAKKYIANADEKTKAELVKGYKDNAKRSFLTDSLKEGMETVRADLESIEKFLNENGKSIWWDVYDYDTAPMGTSRIDFQVEGDWKHDHWAFKDLIQEWADKNGRKIFKIDSREVGESDSDNYTAIYSVYIAKDEESLNTLNSLSALFAEDFSGSFTGLDLED